MPTAKEIPTAVSRQHSAHGRGRGPTRASEHTNEVGQKIERDRVVLNDTCTHQDHLENRDQDRSDLGHRTAITAS